MTSFSEQYLLSRFATGGVAIDLVSGNYFRLNGSAALVCEVLLRANGRTRAKDQVATELDVPPSEAARIIDQVTSTLRTHTIHGPIPGSYHFYPADHGYELRHGDRRVLELEGDGKDAHIRLPPNTPVPASAQLELYVRALAPKLLFQLGTTVLHASACVAENKLLAFAGASGAGKTTTAQAFARSGAQLVSEDLLILSRDCNPAMALFNGEAFVQSWARAVASELLRDPTKHVSSRELENIDQRFTVQLDRVLVLDHSRRAGTELVGQNLAEPDALIALMTHSFLGAVEPDAWRRFFSSAVALLNSVEIHEASAPEGVDHLPAAAKRYISSCTS